MREKNKIKIIFWGTSEFAIPALNALLNAEYSIAAVVTAPNKPAGRKQILTPPPVKAWSMKQETRSTIPILQPEKLDKSFMLQVSSFIPDIFIVAAYGKIIPADILAIPKYGALNIHPSLLPHWRGPSPIQYAILNGDTETGATIMQVDTKIDHGSIVANTKCKMPNADKPTYAKLHNMLAKLGAELLVETLPKYLAGEIMPMPQDESRATYSKILKKEDGHIDWSHSSEEIECMVRAFNLWPRAYSFWQRGGERLKIDILRAQTPNAKRPPARLPAYSAQADDARTGQMPDAESPGVVKKCDGGLCVQTGNGLLEIIELQLESKKPTNAQSFLNGYPEIISEVLT